MLPVGIPAIGHDRSRRRTVRGNPCTRCHCIHNMSKTINSIIGNGKRFIAYDIVKRLEKQQENTLLSKMQSMVNTTQKADNKLHEVFEPSFDWKPAWRQTGNAEHQHSYNRN